MSFDFDNFVNHEWYKKTKIPKGHAKWDDFNILQNKNIKQLEYLITNANGYYDNLRKIYNNGIDLKNREKNGLDEVINFLNLVDSIKNIDDFYHIFAVFHQNNITCIFRINSDIDIMNNTMTRCHFFQDGLNLPDMSYYIDKSKEKYLLEYKKYLDSIIKYIETVTNNKIGTVDDMISIETMLAKISKSKTELRDPHKTYNLVTIEELNWTCSNFKWTKYFNKLNINVPEFMIIDNPDFFTFFCRLLDMPIKYWKTYFKLCIVISCANFSTPYLNDLDNYFYKTILNGIKTQLPLNEEVTRTINGLLGHYLEQLYVAKYFSKKSKIKMEKMVENLKLAFHKRIEHLEWMSNNTKKKAHFKLDSINCKIGYPGKWIDIDYSSLDFNTNYLKNALICRKVDFYYNINKIDKQTDKDEWLMSSQTINAYYNPGLNEIVFPAGILQKPFFSDNQSDIENYAGIGAIIGHELTHGFDDTGRKYNATGNLRDWWDAEDERKFIERTKEIEILYSNSIYFDKKINGKLTLGENIADLGGLLISLDAYKISHPNKDLKEFFIYFAKNRKSLVTKEYANMMITIDSHSPSHLRINNTLLNVPDFYDTFNILKRKKISKIW